MVVLLRISWWFNGDLNGFDEILQRVNEIWWDQMGFKHLIFKWYMGFYKGGMDFTTYLIKDMGMGQNLRPVCFRYEFDPYPYIYNFSPSFAIWTCGKHAGLLIDVLLVDWSTIIVDSESTSQVNGNWWGLMVSMTFCESNMASWEISEVNGASNCRKIIELNDMNILKPTRRWIFSIPTRNVTLYGFFTSWNTSPPWLKHTFRHLFGDPKAPIF